MGSCNKPSLAGAGRILLDKPIITIETFTALLLMALATTMLTVLMVTKRAVHPQPPPR
jgi:hypothetical protein